MQSYFCGWYFKCQSDEQTFAVIPAVHKAGGKRDCSIQLITERGAWNVPFPYSAFKKEEGGVDIAGNHFGVQGISLDLHAPGLSAVGKVGFGPFTPIKYDIMGPFRYVPFMECRHSVLSIRHSVNGELEINGVPYLFHNGAGYLEGDRGRSFPREYAWTQCSFSDGALMLAVADIPLGSYHFTGVIGVVLWKGKEYRLATYLGAKAVRIQDGEVVVEQGRTRLSVKRLEKSAHPLCAPIGGAMSRTIRENVACRASYCFERGGEILFQFETERAAFEYEYHRTNKKSP